MEESSFGPDDAKGLLEALVWLDVMLPPELQAKLERLRDSTPPAECSLEQQWPDCGCVAPEPRGVDNGAQGG